MGRIVGTLGLVVLQGDEAADSAFQPERYEDHGFRPLDVVVQKDRSRFCCRIGHVVVMDDSSAGFQDLLGESGGRSWGKLAPPLLAVREPVGEVHLQGIPLEKGNPNRLIWENGVDLIPHQINDGLKIEFRGQPLLDAVDHRQLGIALARLFQQAVRLFKKAGVFQRHTHAVGQRRQQPDL